MIESTSLFFSILGLWKIMEFSLSPIWKNAILVILYCSIAGLVKVTTLPPFLIFGVLYTIYIQKLNILNKKIFFKIIIIITIFLGIVYFWTLWADFLKEENIYGRYRLTSIKLVSWNFGTLEQKISFKVWSSIFLRNIPEVFGYAWYIVIPAILFFYKKRYIVSSCIILILYCIPIFIFTNLHFVHNYYQYANALFLILFISLFYLYVAKYNKLLSYFLICIHCILCVLYSYNNIYIQDIDKVDIGYKLKEITKPDTAIIVLGTDWSSEVLYYAERKGIAIPEFMYNPDQIKNNYTITGGLNISAVADLKRQPSKEHEEKRKVLTEGMKSFNYKEYVIYYDPKYCLIP